MKKFRTGLLILTVSLGLTLGAPVKEAKALNAGLWGAGIALFIMGEKGSPLRAAGVGLMIAAIIDVGGNAHGATPEKFIEQVKEQPSYQAAAALHGEEATEALLMASIAGTNRLAKALGTQGFPEAAAIAQGMDSGKTPSLAADSSTAELLFGE